MNQRISGHNWERKLAKILTERLKTKFLTSRSESRTLDNMGVDFVSNFPVYFQAKEQTISGKTFSVRVEALDRIEKHERALLVRIWKKGIKRKLHGEYMVVPLEFGLQLLESWQENKKN